MFLIRLKKTEIARPVQKIPKIVAETKLSIVIFAIKLLISKSLWINNAITKGNVRKAATAIEQQASSNED